jgi:hypothetical protein
VVSLRVGCAGRQRRTATGGAATAMPPAPPARRTATPVLAPSAVRPPCGHQRAGEAM